MPSKHFAPYDPTTDGPWDRKQATHLLKRACFGAAKEEVARAVQDGMAATVDRLFDENQAQEAKFQDTFNRVSNALMDFTDAGQLQAWWCYRMLQSATPLREKLTLFWHGHFATSVQKVEDTYLMLQQYDTLRKHAWGPFRDLLLAVCRDPATLVYLDGESNVKEHPNENFARELLELFTLGIGNYAEKDVQEAARAFTGWHRDGSKFQFDADAHDGEPKTFLGKGGKLDGTEVVDVLVEQPATARRLARKLLVFFAAPEPAEDVVAEAATMLADAKLNVQAFLRTLLQSKYFYSAACHGMRIASPVEFVIGTCRALNVRITAQQLPPHLTAMGQELFAPPNVKGWDGEKKWINSSTWAARTAFAQFVADLAADGPFGNRLPLTDFVPEKASDPKEIVGMLAGRVLDGMAEEQRAELAEFLITADDGPQPERFQKEPEFRMQQIRATLAAMLSLPEYHAI